MNAHESFFALLTGTKQADSEAASATPGPDKHAPHAPPGLWTVLCVDDDAHTQFALKRVLRGAGYCVMAATSGEQALQMLQAMGQRSMVDVVLSEMQLTGDMSGADLLEQVHAQWPQMVRIVLTGHADLDATIEAINRGRILRHLGKPWDAGELLATLCDGIGQLSATRSTQRQHALVQAQNEALLRQNAELETRLQHGGGQGQPALQQAAQPGSQLGLQLGVQSGSQSGSQSGLQLGVQPGGLAGLHLQGQPALQPDMQPGAQQPGPPVPAVALALALVSAPVLPPDPGAERQAAGQVEAVSLLAATPPAAAHPIPIPSAALEPGMELANDLISQRGVLMLMAGHRFTLSLIRRVRDFERREGSPLLIHIQPNLNTRTPE